jgi:signal transduction histidine kinase
MGAGRVDGRVILTVSDNGVGFSPDEEQRHQAHDRGMGLQGMKERAALVGGSLEIESRPNEGTSVVAIVPLGSQCVGDAQRQ